MRVYTVTSRKQLKRLCSQENCHHIKKHPLCRLGFGAVEAKPTVPETLFVLNIVLLKEYTGTLMQGDKGSAAGVEQNLEERNRIR